jgi:curved DNA-binding protein CbpA
LVPPLISLALEYYRDPLAYSHLADVSKPLPKGFSEMLAEFGAGLSTGTITETARLLGTDARELEAAARFFVRHALLDPAGDYYRYLGLPRDASETTVRKHYRLLIRMFHPDRAVQQDDADLAYASRLNAAYHVLQDPEERGRYDQGLPKLSSRRVHGDPVAFFSPRPTVLEIADSGRGAWAHNLSGRSMVLGALLATVLGGGAYLLVHTPDAPTLRASQTLSDRDLKPRPSYLNDDIQAAEIDPTSVAERDAAESGKAPDSSPEIAAPGEDESSELKAGKTADESEPVGAKEPQPPSAPALKTPTGKSFEHWLAETIERDKARPRPSYATAERAASPALSRSDRESASAPTALTRNSEVPTSSESAAAIGARMIGRLERTYRQGNADAFAALFTSNARTTDGSGKALIRRQYAQLFRKSRSQQLLISNMRWRTGSNGAILANGRVSVGVQDAASGAWRRSNGSISLELVPMGGEYRISAMHYDTN